MSFFSGAKSYWGTLWKINFVHFFNVPEKALVEIEKEKGNGI